MPVTDRGCVSVTRGALTAGRLIEWIFGAHDLVNARTDLFDVAHPRHPGLAWLHGAAVSRI
jgi:hypothetical protein